MHNSTGAHDLQPLGGARGGHWKAALSQARTINIISTNGNTSIKADFSKTNTNLIDNFFRFSIKFLKISSIFNIQV